MLLQALQRRGFTACGMVDARVALLLQESSDLWEASEAAPTTTNNLRNGRCMTFRTVSQPWRARHREPWLIRRVGNHT